MQCRVEWRLCAAGMAGACACTWLRAVVISSPAVVSRSALGSVHDAVWGLCRFNAVDERCAVELDCTDAAVIAGLLTAADDHLAANGRRFERMCALLQSPFSQVRLARPSQLCGGFYHLPLCSATGVQRSACNWNGLDVLACRAQRRTPGGCCRTAS